MSEKNFCENCKTPVDLNGAPLPEGTPCELLQAMGGESDKAAVEALWLCPVHCASMEARQAEDKAPERAGLYWQALSLTGLVVQDVRRRFHSLVDSMDTSIASSIAEAVREHLGTTPSPLANALSNIRLAAHAEQIEPEDWGLLRDVIREAEELLKVWESEVSKAAPQTGLLREGEEHFPL